MGLSSRLAKLLFFLELCEICRGFEQGNCTDYKLQFERVFSVPGDVAMLNSTLVSPDVFDFKTVPYTITWYNSMSGQEITNQTGHILVNQETLWILNATLSDSGDYVTILRTPSHCYRQATKLVVEERLPGECGRPKKAFQVLTKGVTDNLSCPLRDHINKLRSYNITSSIKWYKDCEPIEDGTNIYEYWDTKLKINHVELHHKGTYTCTLTFTLGGVKGSVSESIDATVTEEYSLVPQVHEPTNEVVKAQRGFNFSKRCLVFVPGDGKPSVDILWLAREDFIETNTSHRVHMLDQRMLPNEGAWLERLLMFSELQEEDLYTNYTCRVYSDRGFPERYFSLQPADPNITLPIGSVLGSVMVLFIITVILYYVFKIDIVLWFRRAFPVLYSNKDLDGKLYDAYVAYPQPYDLGFNKEVETFALQTLPQVLEMACDYKLFIAGRDCLPGQSLVDSVEENIQASRRVLLLYTASTFTTKRHTSSTSSNNNNISKSAECSVESERNPSDSCSIMSSEVSDKVYTDTRQHLEYMAAMHRVLLEGSLKVVLVELEEITPAQLALFPESVRHLRKKQGAVCWWKSQRTGQRWKTRMSETDAEKGETDSQLSPSLSPSSRFWKEVRYHMPVRGKRVLYPEKTALL
ncbi:interleukin-1 receptor type 1-like isoform X2 [Archocentrus centrarchus]|uniref:interleukin-1 receptor type 1-like isoform X2 n=1 Tax=Archocentrus centrarchus TaxID=63155 RepID=UPI0011E9DCF8|nr:interleukin-1 receptor type 1-like isoform X2 [Archocentrus centrarchus]